MKSKLLITALMAVLSFNSFAITYEIIGPCSEVPTQSGSFDLNDLSVNAGKISVAIFDQQKIPYVGSVQGFISINNTLTGIDSTEVLSDTKMRAYGWCYSVNGAIPDILASEYLFSSNNDKLVWFYGYSTYEDGKWSDYCVPSYTVKAAQFCSK